MRSKNCIRIDLAAIFDFLAAIDNNFDKLSKKPYANIQHFACRFDGFRFTSFPFYFLCVRVFICGMQWKYPHCFAVGISMLNEFYATNVIYTIYFERNWIWQPSSTLITNWNVLRSKMGRTVSGIRNKKSTKLKVWKFERKKCFHFITSLPCWFHELILNRFIFNEENRQWATYFEMN